MSVILFNKGEVFQRLADAYEGLKQVIEASEEDDKSFYKSLRRLHFANVATYLCQYHDDTLLSDAELAGIDPFISLQGEADPLQSDLEKLNQFIGEWSHLQYNLVTNDGEEYQATTAYEFMNGLAMRLSRAVVSGVVGAEQKP